MKLRGHTDNIRSLLLDSTGRFVWKFVFDFPFMPNNITSTIEK